ncbi:hypothetical protein SCNU_17797 [Gordonia neofelifaecis NRRL B-59395]|uniref:Uncharacterized protein n=1 Tax=Gordonia neofelifaecis NRRL B-59395 TaxID=644548 RepID=F1YNR3_9ACTN|nr:hypothetical protein SCNU_17797 [Gordonia neofelifaecis NRRL B-59395]
MADGPLRLEIDFITPIIEALGSGSAGGSSGDTPTTP